MEGQRDVTSRRETGGPSHGVPMSEKTRERAFCTASSPHHNNPDVGGRQDLPTRKGERGLTRGGSHVYRNRATGRLAAVGSMPKTRSAGQANTEQRRKRWALGGRGVSRGDGALDQETATRCLFRQKAFLGPVVYRIRYDQSMWWARGARARLQTAAAGGNRVSEK